MGLDTDKDTYATRQKISVRVSPMGAGNNPLSADCSLSVFRVDSLQQMDGEFVRWIADAYDQVGCGNR